MTASSLPRRIAVLIPAHNAESTISKALESLAANAEPHDIVLVDDGSIIPLEKYLLPHPNLTILRTEHNQGIAAALNLGLRHILERGYEFVARLDVDDTAAPDRLRLQRVFMENNPDVALAGSWARVVSEKGQTLFYLNHPTTHKGIVTKSFYNSCFIHPAMMMRTEALRTVGLYSESFDNAEDYELTRRMARYGKLANLPHYLVNYTLSLGGLSLRKRRKQLRSRLKIQWEYRDFGNIHFYLGTAKTLVLSLLPYRLIAAIKTGIKPYRKIAQQESPMISPFLKKDNALHSLSDRGEAPFRTFIIALVAQTLLTHNL